MEENKPATLPKFNSTEELIEFCETHDMGDYDLPEVNFEVSLRLSPGSGLHDAYEAAAVLAQFLAEEQARNA